MSNSGNRNGYVNTSSTGNRDGRPRVSLPPAQPRVNLPPAPQYWSPPSNQYHAPPPAPATMSFDQSFPALGSPQPRINIPAMNNLEDQMRGMILRNEAEIQPYPRQRNGFPSQQQQRFPPNHTYSRPPPGRKQLFDPASQIPQNERHQPRRGIASVQAQVSYLDIAVRVVIPKVQMTIEEYNEKERLRNKLEKVCQKAVFEFERTRKGPHFKAETVELKCFGSMSTTFATKSSDMDLVLISPLSEEAAANGSDIPRIIEKALLDSGYGVRLLTKTRVPIIRFCEKPAQELRELLLKERAKFETERDSPPKDTKKSSKKSKDIKSKDVKQDSLDPKLAQARAEEVSQGLAQTGMQKVKEGTDIAEPKQTSDHKVGSQGDTGSQNHKSPASIQTERNDPDLLNKSDDERARLYRLAIQEDWYEAAERVVINNFLAVISTSEATEEDKSMARAPLLDLPNVIGRYRPPPESHPLEFPKTGVGIQCDINFSNHLALHNSHLLKCYSLCDSRVREMVLFVKTWSKKRKINTPYHGTLSSYGYVLMVLHYLINVAQPSVLPNLQQMPLAFEDEMSAKITELDGHNIQFLRNERAIEYLRNRQDMVRNTETVGSLLKGFFHYFAHPGYNSPFSGFSWSMDVLSLRTIGGLLPKQAKGWTGAKTEHVEMQGPGEKQTKEIRQRYLFAIEDPFEIEHNIARTVVHNGIVAIRDEFRRAHKLIEHAGMMRGGVQEDLLEEIGERENLQYRPFGPRPRNTTPRNGNGRPNGE